MGLGLDGMEARGEEWGLDEESREDGEWELKEIRRWVHGVGVEDRKRVLQRVEDSRFRRDGDDGGNGFQPEESREVVEVLIGVQGTGCYDGGDDDDGRDREYQQSWGKDESPGVGDTRKSKVDALEMHVGVGVANLHDVVYKDGLREHESDDGGDLGDEMGADETDGGSCDLMIVEHALAQAVPNPRAGP